MAAIQEYSSERYIEKWKMKKLIKEVEAASGRGVGTRTMISLLIPPGDDDQISRAVKTLDDEFLRSASNMVPNEQQISVLGALIDSAQHRLSLYKNIVSPNGFALYVGNVNVTGKNGVVTTIIDFEPFKPINEFMCICDNKFHTEALDELLQSDDEKFGFIVMEGKWGALFGTLRGNKPEVLHITRVYLPKNLFRTDDQQFYRCRKRKEDDYMRETAELARQFFINPSTGQPNVDRLILAGGDEFKTKLSQSDMFDSRLKAKVVDVLDVPIYYPKASFYIAMESSEILSNGKFVQERRLISQLIKERKQNANKCVVGFDETVKALEMGGVKILVVWENLEISRFTLKNCRTGEIVVKHLNKEEEESNLENNFYRDSSALDVQLVVKEKMSLVEWFVNVYKQFGCSRLELVTNSYYNGCPFFHPEVFGGIGGILH